MNRKTRKLLTAVLAAVLALVLTGCSSYVSHYSAVGFVHSNTSGSASMNFYSFDGTMVFRLNAQDAGERIRYSAKLESGSAAVFYDAGGTKTLLFSIGPGETVSASGAPLEKGTVHLLVETDGKCTNGEFRFELGASAEGL